MMDTKNFSVPDTVVVKRMYGVITIVLWLLHPQKQGVYIGIIKG